jgi:prolyl-tRNA synthetase
VILNLSNLVGQQLLAGKSVLLFIDVVPDLDPGQLNLGLNDLFRTKSNRLVKNVLDEFVPNALIPHLLSRAEIDEKKFAHRVTLENGERATAFMGCYGIGTTRLVGTIVEACHDDAGIVWPVGVAPFAVHLVSLYGRDTEGQERVRTASEELYAQLTRQGIEVLWDDRADMSAGAKFADADLLGMPVRLILSEKTLTEGSVEWKQRAGGEAHLVPIEQIEEKLRG